MPSSLQTRYTQKPFRLKKLAMWGKRVDLSEINFEWPTEAIVSQFKPGDDVYLRSMNMRTCTSSTGRLSSIECTLSNDVSSPVFKTNRIH